MDRITPTNTISAALEPRPTPAPVIGRPCSSWYSHALARSHARNQRRPPSHRHRSLMTVGGGDGWDASSVGDHRALGGCGGGRGGWRRGLTSSSSLCLAASVSPVVVWPLRGHEGGVISSAAYSVRSILLLILATVPPPSGGTRRRTTINICLKITPSLTKPRSLSRLNNIFTGNNDGNQIPARQRLLV
ncbi:hypothetical protein E2C01_073888 [Portunus trituberculatus]|uniref:Uncharacterized protein n=1 Tax=Portunus trituberculatus TaxID=210409 RepID=A0A5B7I6J3_PORTR|nr:hypothetical protein [Portunus trituberculatus]